MNGAIAMILAQKALLKRWTKPLSEKFHTTKEVFVPSIMGLGPDTTTNILVKNTGIKLEQMGLLELNEAFPE